MTPEEDELEVERSPVILPWIVGAGAFVVYAVTLNHWVSPFSLGFVTWVAGWSWQPQVSYPLTAIVLWPFGLLPEPWIPLALNLFTSLCAALVLVLLTRTVALMTRPPAPDPGVPDDYQFAELCPRIAWMPPLLAALACGLQLTFWEQGTSGTGDVIGLLLLAYIIRCLLEFRNDQNDSWLARAAFLYGAGLADNWGLWLYLPIFLIAIVRLRLLRKMAFGYDIRNPRFLLPLALWGLAGLSLYLLLPALCSLSSVRHVAFWAALKANLRSQKDALQLFLHIGKGLLVLATCLPLLAISFRWDFGPARSAKFNLSVWITHVAIHVVHAVLLLASLWLMLDPPFSPRSLGYGASPVGQYYISALVIGYCAAYFLAIGSQTTIEPSDSEVPGLRRGLEHLTKLAIPAVFALLIVVPVAMVARNLGQIRITNGPALRDYTRQLYDALPAGKSVALSDASRELYFMRAEVGAHSPSKETLLLDTRYLGLEQYQKFMARQFKERWPNVAGTNSHEQPKPLSPPVLLSQLSTNESLIYLHPGFDYCFEQFVERPAGPIHFLLQRPLPGAIALRLDEPTAATNEHYWEQRWTASLQALARQAGERSCQPPPWAAKVFDALYLKTEQNTTAAFVSDKYARSLNYLGVQLQRLGRWKDAQLWFQRALELNPDNLSARINLEYNQRHQSEHDQGQQVGQTHRLSREEIESRFSDLFGKHRTWESAIWDSGPVDEPTYLAETAAFLEVAHNYHQAIGQLLRCIELAPDWPEPRIGVAESYLAQGDFDGCLRSAERLSGGKLVLTRADEARLVSCRARALFGLKREKDALLCIGTFVGEHQEKVDLEVILTAMQLYLQFKQYTLALPLLDQLLALQPDNPELLQSKALAHFGLQQYEEAIATFTQVLERDPSNPAARINRANACLRATQVDPSDSANARRLDQARADYEELLKRFPRAYQVLYGLAEVAWRKQETNAAIEFSHQYLANANPESAEYKAISDRLRQLQPKQL